MTDVVFKNNDFNESILKCFKYYHRIKGFNTYKAFQY